MKTNLFIVTSFILFGWGCSKSPTKPNPPPAPKQTPTVAVTVTSTTETSIAVSGTITSEGSSVITTKGFYWNTTSPATAGTKVTVAEGSGTFPFTISNLSPSTTIYLTAWAKSNDGEGVSAEIGATTLNAAIPKITLLSITNITSNGATTGGSIAPSSSTITERGVCVDTFPNPDLSDWKTIDGSGTGNFASTITGQNPMKKHYLRAYYKYAGGTVYSAQDSFNTSGYYIGEQGYGGVIFWASTDARRALVAAKQDINPGQGAAWWPQGGPYQLLGANNHELGGGDFNTNIIATHPQCQPTAAARLCYDVAIQGYTDWYLPNKEEMRELWLQRNLPGIVGTFLNESTWHRYWTSSEGDLALDALFLHYNSGGIGTDIKGGGGGVRPIRKVGNW